MSTIAFYVDPTYVPAGTKLPRLLRCADANLPAKGIELASKLTGDGQIGFYLETAFGKFQGYAIQENGVARFELAKERKIAAFLMEELPSEKPDDMKRLAGLLAQMTPEQAQALRDVVREE